MKTTQYICLFTLIFFNILIANTNTASVVSKKILPGRDGLFTFPRVGRGNVWSRLLYYGRPAEENYDIDTKRALKPFPRIGRSRLAMPLIHLDNILVDAEEDSSAQTGMWFGPRLGRSVTKRSGQDKPDEDNFVILAHDD